MPISVPKTFMKNSAFVTKTPISKRSSKKWKTVNIHIPMTAGIQEEMIDASTQTI